MVEEWASRKGKEFERDQAIIRLFAREVSTQPLKWYVTDAKYSFGRYVEVKDHMGT